VTQIPEILFENERYLVVGKPSGWLSVPAREPKPEDAVMSHYLRVHAEDIRVIHRLDRFTSGVMLFAKSEEAQREGSKWFEDRIVKKIYHFIATPAPSRPAIQIKTPVDGKAAQTLFEVNEKAALAFYGKATPLTGRFHQIREHAQVAGFPLLGDKAYGGKMEVKLESETLVIPRVCLHAARLELPFGVFEMPMPEDLANVWRKLQNV
jgi:23S rRNA-/tRNA-specific pseudouridylate synthase